MGKPFTSLFKPASSPSRARGKEAVTHVAACKLVAPSSLSMSSTGGDPERVAFGGEASAETDQCPFSPRQLTKLRDAFDFFDINNDGRISSGELRKVLRFLGSRVTEQEAQRIIADVDINCNGTVEFNEFVAMMSTYHRKSHRAGEAFKSAEEAEILEAFEAFDHNGDNYIDFTELKKTMQFLGEDVTDEDIECMIREADIDNDGRIDFEEFKRLLATVKRRL